MKFPLSKRSHMKKNPGLPVTAGQDFGDFL